MAVLDTRVIWNTRRLAKEFNLPIRQVSRLLRALGATRFTRASRCSSSKWVYEG